MSRKLTEQHKKQQRVSCVHTELRVQQLGAQDLRNIMDFIIANQVIVFEILV